MCLSAILLLSNIKLVSYFTLQITFFAYMDVLSKDFTLEAKDTQHDAVGVVKLNVDTGTDRPSEICKQTIRLQKVQIFFFKNGILVKCDVIVNYVVLIKRGQPV